MLCFLFKVYALSDFQVTKGKKVKVFELDQVNTLNVKVETLKKAGIEHDWRVNPIFS